MSTPRLEEALCWYAGIRAVRPTFSLGVVTPPEIGIGPLARFTEPVSVVVSPAELAEDRISAELLDAVRAVSLEGRILEELVDRYGAGILAERQLLECVIARAAGGGKLYRVADDLRVDPGAVSDRLTAVGCRTVDLRSHVRHRAYEIRIASGTSPAQARIACGWYTREARRKCAQRLRDLESE
jgi:hypothetical protein